MKFTQAKTFPNLMRIMVVAGLMVIGFATGPVSAMSIDKLLTVNVIQVCDNGGIHCASTGPDGDLFFEQEVDKIWAQAGIDVDFVMGSQLNSDGFYTIDDTVAAFQDISGGAKDTVTMWLVSTIGTDGTILGESWMPGGGLVIAMHDVMAYNGGAGRIDTIAHELGHNLGLVPGILDGVGGHSPNSNYLMASGGNRSVPTTAANIAPDGLGLDFLPTDQIDYARRSTLLQDVTPVPEPGSYALLTIGLIALITLRRRSAVMS